MLALSLKIMDLRETMDTFLQGLKLMLLACGILVLAWSLGTVTSDMQLAGFIIILIGDNMSFTFLPFVILLFGCLISFSTGTSWGTMAILTPIAILLGYKNGGPVPGNYNGRSGVLGGHIR
jgi:Na+/H+ antiporter NhaC